MGLRWRDVEINLIDTPGHSDFSAETSRALRVIDGVILVISAVEGVQSQTEVLWQALQKLRIPTIIFLNKLDRLGANVPATLSQIRDSLTPNAVLLRELDGTPDDAEALLEFVADRDLETLSRFTEEATISRAFLVDKLRALTGKFQAHPVICGSALKGEGIARLLDAVIEFLPAPAGKESDPLSAVIYKISHDQRWGRVAHVRLFAGTIRSRELVVNTSRQLEEKVVQIRQPHRAGSPGAEMVAAGDLACLSGLRQSKLGDVLGDPRGVPPGYDLAVPLLSVRVNPKREEDFLNLAHALEELDAEDSTLEFKWYRDEKELTIDVVGLIQLEILETLLQTRFGLAVSFGPPSIIYKETPAQKGYGYVRYTMPKPCWAVMRLLIEPAPRGYGWSFRSAMSYDVIPERYQKQIEKALPRALAQGLRAWPVTDLKITLVDGEYHVVHTHPPDFLVATPMAIMDGLVNTQTKLLEPILDFRISGPQEASGRIISDLQQRRAVLDTPSFRENRFTLEGQVPAAEVMEYPVQLATGFQGQAIMTTRFSGYQECPPQITASRERRGVNPLDRARYILSVRGAIGDT